MNFLDNFELICIARGESPSHALFKAGLDQSLYPKWKKDRSKIPSGTTIQKLADYFGCTVQRLLPNDREETTRTLMSIMLALDKLTPEQQDNVLAYILFTYREELPDEMQKLRR